MHSWKLQYYVDAFGSKPICKQILLPFAFGSTANSIIHCAYLVPTK